MFEQDLPEPRRLRKNAFYLGSDGKPYQYLGNGVLETPDGVKLRVDTANSEITIPVKRVYLLDSFNGMAKKDFLKKKKNKERCLTSVDADDQEDRITTGR